MAINTIPHRLLAKVLDYAEANPVCDVVVSKKFLNSISWTQKYRELFEAHLVKAYFPQENPEGDRVQAVYKALRYRIVVMCSLPEPGLDAPDARQVAQLAHATDRVLFFMNAIAVLPDAPVGKRATPVVERSREIYFWLKNNRARLNKIYSISLVGYGLTSLPLEIEWFTGLRSLDLRKNNLTRFPKEILTGPLSLSRLVLSMNLLTHIPQNIDRLGPTLRTLWLDRNRLVKVPNALAQINLQDFRIWGNENYQPSPEMVAFCNTPLKQLERPHDFGDVGFSGVAPNGAICAHCVQRQFERDIGAVLGLMQSKETLEASQKTLEEVSRKQKARANPQVENEALKASEKALEADLRKQAERAKLQAEQDAMSCWQKLVQSFFSFIQEIKEFFLRLFG